ncbi:hypothetical protein HG530_003704 [Fusarium avenaceum]|nr:hypothetical protein HG530_003704 [Fusarium avenaceum]
MPSSFATLIQSHPSNDIEETTENLSHFKILPAIIETEIRQHIEQNSGPSNDSIISFNFAFALVEPGVEAMSHVNGHERLYTLTSGRYSNLQDEKMAYLRNVRYIDTDGVSFGSRGTELFIWLFENVKSISELESVPAYIQANRDEVRQRLFKRGSFFESLKYACRNWSHKAQHVTEERIDIDCLLEVS